MTRRLIGAVLAAYALLVATHEGEFWPFSIYPMFSQAGRPWLRALVVDVSAPLADERDLWRSRTADDLPGPPFATSRAGINANDLANLASKVRDWDATRLAMVHGLFETVLDADRRLLVMRVHGDLDPGAGGVSLRYQPLLVMTAAGAVLSPHFRPGEEE